MPRLSLEIEVKDKASKEFKKLEAELDKYGVKVKQFDKNNKQATTSLSSMAVKLGVIGLSVGTVYKAYDKIIVNGFAFNKLMEEQVNGIRALIVATSDNITTTGRAITLTEKYALANTEAKNAMAELQKINALTPHTLGQTSQIFKAMFTTSKAAGASLEEMVKMTKLVSIAAGSAGVEFQQLLASVDGLANGTFLANSEMGRFLTSIGLSGNELKEMAKEGKSVEFIIEKLSDFNFKADSMGEATSNLANAWDQLVGKITAATFEDTKAILGDITKAIEWLTNINVKEGQTLIFSPEDVTTVKDAKGLIAEYRLEIEKLNSQMKQVTDNEFLTKTQKMPMLTSLMIDIKDTESLIKELEGSVDKLQTKSELKVVKDTFTRNDKGFASDNVSTLKFERDKRNLEKLQAEIEKWKDPVESALSSGMSAALETQDFTVFATNMSRALTGALSDTLAKQATTSLQGQFGETGGIAAMAGIGLAIGAIASLFQTIDYHTQSQSEILQEAADALKDMANNADALGKSGTAIGLELQSVFGNLDAARASRDAASAESIRLTKKLDEMILDIFSGDFRQQVADAQALARTTEADYQRLLATLSGDIVSIGSELASMLMQFGEISDAVSGTTDFQDAILARAKAQLPIYAQSQAGFKAYVAGLSQAGLQMNDLLATIEASAEGSAEYKAALAELTDMLGLSGDATLEQALNTVESIELVGDSFASLADTAKETANSIKDIINSQQQFLDTNRSLVETSGESVSRLQDRFVEEINEANLAQIMLDEARLSGNQAAIAEAVANLNEQEQDVLNLGQSVIDNAQTAYGSTDAATDIINAILGEVESRQTNLLSVQESLQVEANEISLSILEQLQILNAHVVTTSEVFNTAVAA